MSVIFFDQPSKLNRIRLAAKTVLALVLMSNCAHINIILPMFTCYYIFSNLVMTSLLISHASHNRGHLCIVVWGTVAKTASLILRVRIKNGHEKLIYNTFWCKKPWLVDSRGKNKILAVDLLTMWCYFLSFSLRTALVNVWRGLGLVWPWPPSVMSQHFSWPPLFQSQHSEPSPYRFVCVFFFPSS